MGIDLLAPDECYIPLPHASLCFPFGTVDLWQMTL